MNNFEVESPESIAIEEPLPFFWDPKILPEGKDPVPLLEVVTSFDFYKRARVDKQREIYKDEPIFDLKIDHTHDKKLNEADLIKLLSC